MAGVQVCVASDSDNHRGLRVTHGGDAGENLVAIIKFA